ncbi:phosphate/phosphite/phosphonate ABC transporter substrate-binding protein [Gulosibacter chungangensis]|uniref:phosphate/phosphite/phosphonate ABC transporter substrate-binding protein n=1 Tax=Gulosibacter chungangensis TaxID=979746 RepID=UPI001787F558|nr:phosphate/phosphite/phosphonate ABC transporter substrate-binding protein [Gulosibacter chungangensis]
MKNRSPILATLAIAALALTGCASNAGSAADNADATASSQVLTIAAVPSEDATMLEQKFELFREVVEAETGMQTELVQSTDYTAVIEALVADQADIAIGSPFTYVRSVNAGATVEAIGGAVYEKDEPAGYQSFALVRADSDITDLSQAADKSVCFVEQGSTSGYLYPSAGLLDVGIDPETDIDPIFAGAHDASVLQLLEGECEIAFAYDAMVTNLMPAQGDLSEDDYKIIWESPMIAASPVFMNTNTIDPETQEQLRTLFENLMNADALVEAGYCTDVEECIERMPETNYGYVPVDDSTYDGLREVCEITQAEACNE